MTMTDQAPDQAMLAAGQAGDQVRYCRRPGCGAPIQQAGHGRPRQYCSDACTSLYHNQSRASRARGTDTGAVTAEAGILVTGPDGDPLAGLEALLRQAAALARHASAEAARLDPAQVRAELADADAGRRRAEAAAARADADAAITAARAHADAAITASRAETGACQQQARQAADDAAAMRSRADAEITRARQAETDARAETERSRADAARERDALHAAHNAQLQACRQLADLHRERAERAETALDAVRAQQRHPAAEDADSATAEAGAGAGQQPAPRRARTRTGQPAST